MSLFVKTETITIDDTEITISELGVDYLLLSETQKANTKEVLEMHTSLSKDEINSLTISAFQTILDAFYKLNDEHFSPKDNNSDKPPK